MLAGVLIGQIGLGILNIMLLAPVWLQIVHLFVAELFWFCGACFGNPALFAGGLLFRASWLATLPVRIFISKRKARMK